MECLKDFRSLLVILICLFLAFQSPSEPVIQNLETLQNCIDFLWNGTGIQMIYIGKVCLKLEMLCEISNSAKLLMQNYLIVFVSSHFLT